MSTRPHATLPTAATAARLTAVALLTFAFAACARDNPEGQPAPTSRPTVSAPAANSNAAAAAQYTDADLPVDADFEEEADKAIDTRSYKADLAAIHAEIGDVPDGTAPSDAAD